MKGLKKKKAKWIPFGGTCQGMPLRKHTTCNRVCARDLLGEGESENVKHLLEWGQEEAREERRGNRNETGEQAVLWWAPLKGAHVA